MAIAVVGFDMGYLNSFVAVARAGGIETVANEYSDRCTASCVSFSDSIRFIGNSAKQRVLTNPRDTIHGFTRFLGKNFDDPSVQAELPFTPYNLVKLENGSVGFKVNYLNEEATFSAEQVAAMLLTKLKTVAQSNLGTPVVDCVLNVPTYWTDRERRALLDATHIAGLNCLKLINDLTAIGLNYGIYKKDLPAVDKPSKNVAFVDMGHNHLQVAVIAFNEGQMRVLATASDPSLGGRDFDRAIFSHFADDIKQRFKLDVRSNAKATMRLLEECSKVKKLMSANSTDIPLNIECLMQDRDVNGRINRETFNGLLDSAGLLVRVEQCLSRCLTLAKLQPKDIASVELVGGSTRVPAVKDLVTKVFGQSPMTTLNADEAVARGCALMCAILSPAFKVREFSISDWQPYSISLSYRDADGKDDSVEVFPEGYQFPMSRTLTFYRKAAFELAAHYTNPQAVPTPLIGKFSVGNVQPSPSGEAARIKVKVRLNSHGIFTVSQAKLAETVEKVVDEPEEKMETDAPAESAEVVAEAEAAPGGTAADSAGSPMEVGADQAERQQQQAAAPADPKKSAEKKTKKVTRYTDLPIDADCVKQLSKKLLTDFQEREANMVLQETREHERCLARNTVEEYVYEMRDKLSSVLEQFVSEAERESYSQLLTATEDWIYGDGENLAKQAYVDKLAELRGPGERFLRRAKEFEERPRAADALGHALQHARKAVEAWRNGEEALAHLTEEEMKRVSDSIDEKQQWLITQQNEQNRLAANQDPSLTSADIRSQHSALESAVNPILNKPKPQPPKVEEPPPQQQQPQASTQPPADGAAGPDATAQDGDQNAAPGSAKKSTSGGAKVNGKEADMDLD
ncbi:hypothetical protein BOX15_Mlig019152g3 [Macrostomum lignano]|uniref:EF-hand domain-containing protein n=1 Tax=Macrostomum lignano TaxID=282301 RepID=A0A267GYD9_9PLAT|nr:hypothetical protein BOX15_Mlig019152g3 [Macrostomum lignano]